MCVIFVVGDLDTITFYPIASTILKWLILKIVRWLQYLHHSALLNSGLGFHGYIIHHH
jgi:hypothetical protein